MDSRKKRAVIELKNYGMGGQSIAKQLGYHHRSINKFLKRVDEMGQGERCNPNRRTTWMSSYEQVVYKIR